MRNQREMCHLIQIQSFVFTHDRGGGGGGVNWRQLKYLSTHSNLRTWAHLNMTFVHAFTGSQTFLYMCAWEGRCTVLRNVYLHNKNRKKTQVAKRLKVQIRSVLINQTVQTLFCFTNYVINKSTYFIIMVSWYVYNTWYLYPCKLYRCQLKLISYL